MLGVRGALIAISLLGPGVPGLAQTPATPVAAAQALSDIKLPARPFPPADSVSRSGAAPPARWPSRAVAPTLRIG
jgi:hypothetical protein